jgi:regulatory protein
LDQLTSHGYLDDRQFIEGYIHSRREYKHYGRHRIELELRLKGLDPALVTEMLEHLYSPDEDQLELRRTLEKKLLGLSPPMDAKKVAKLYNYLLRQGFSREATYREIRRRFKDVDLTE